MDNVHKVNYCINEPSSQTLRSYLEDDRLWCLASERKVLNSLLNNQNMIASVE
jgi:hypothetical protein